MFEVGDIVNINIGYARQHFLLTAVSLYINKPLIIMSEGKDDLYVIKTPEGFSISINKYYLEQRGADFCECTNEKLFKVGCSCGFLTRILKKVGHV